LVAGGRRRRRRSGGRSAGRSVCVSVCCWCEWGGVGVPSSVSVGGVWRRTYLCCVMKQTLPAASV
jgi:hypothetical protein